MKSYHKPTLVQLCETRRHSLGLQVCFHVGSKGFKHRLSPCLLTRLYALVGPQRQNNSSPTGCSQEGTIINQEWKYVGHRHTCCCHHFPNIMREESKGWIVIKVASPSTNCMLAAKCRNWLKAANILPPGRTSLHWNTDHSGHFLHKMLHIFYLSGTFTWGLETSPAQKHCPTAA